MQRGSGWCAIPAGPERAAQLGVDQAPEHNDRLQTDADCERVLDGIASNAPNGHSMRELDAIVEHLGSRWFLMRDVHALVPTLLLQPRWAASLARQSR